MSGGGGGEKLDEGSTTSPGFGDPSAGEGPIDVNTIPSPPPRMSTPGAEAEPLKPERRESQPSPPAEKSRRRGTPLIEIEVIHEHGPAPSTDRPWRMTEIWTRNRIYKLDPTLRAVEVVDRASREVVTEHPFLGMRMVGGQHREGDSIELSHPFPRPGTEAVFEHEDAKGGSFSRTSAVTRVILRLHIVTVSPSYVVPTWETITGSFPAVVEDT